MGLRRSHRSFKGWRQFRGLDEAGSRASTGIRKDWGLGLRSGLVTGGDRLASALRSHNCRLGGSVQDGRNRARGVYAPDDDGQPTLASEGEGSRVHDLQVSGNRLVMGEAIEPDRVRVLLRIRGVDAVDLRRLEYRIAAQFRGAEHR